MLKIYGTICTMKKVIAVVVAGLVCMPAVAGDTHNPMFGTDTNNSVSLHVGQGTGAGTLFKLVDPFLWEFETMTSLMAQYSQPMKIFRLPARMNFNVVQNFGYRNKRGLSFTAVGVSWDVSLFDWRGFYIGVGIGPYMRDSRDRYVNSRLVFGERVFIGKNVSDNWRIEFFTQHFSNGDFTETNRGFNFTGLAVGYSF